MRDCRSKFWWMFCVVAAAALSACEARDTEDRAVTTTIRAVVAEQGWPRAGFSEQAADPNTRFPNTVATDVAISAPLPESFPEHPPACDQLHVLRIRHVQGPADPSDADRILIAQPGVVEGASAFYNVAANLVTRAFEERGKYLEFWAVDRRPNCLEDWNGLRLARETGNPRDFIDYYFRGLDYQGQRFAGFLDPLKDAAWLAEMGMEQTLKDWNEIITRGIPDPTTRQEKVYLGGHSLGGFILGAYAAWDFDGDASTLADAGYRQCAGMFGLDTLVTDASLVSAGLEPSLLTTFLTGLLGTVPADAVEQIRSGASARFFTVDGVIDPQLMHLWSGLGYLAHLKPDEESDVLQYLPTTSNGDLALRFYHSRDVQDFLAPEPTIMHTRYTNQALLAVFTDDNSMPISIIRASLGFFDGGSLAEKQFPIPTELADVLTQIPLINTFASLVGGANLAIASDQGLQPLIEGPLYRWVNYDQIDKLRVPDIAFAEPYTSASREVTDIDDFARSVGALPLNFVEVYFPSRLGFESVLGVQGAVHTNALSVTPVLNISAGDGPHLGGDNLPPRSPIIPGYDHLDVLTASPVQNDGQPEPVSTNLLEFIF